MALLLFGKDNLSYIQAKTMTYLVHMTEDHRQFLLLSTLSDFIYLTCGIRYTLGRAYVCGHFQ